jgi:hypothetical protein
MLPEAYERSASLGWLALLLRFGTCSSSRGDAAQY